MPTRILREGILTSEPVNSLSHEAELFYRRLMSALDDYGRYFAHPSLLRAACYPLQLEKVSEANVKQLLSECVSAGVLVVYNNGKHLFCPNFRQQTRAPSKYPEPSQAELLSKCKSDVKQMRSESESESESQAKPRAKERALPEVHFPTRREVEARADILGLAKWKANDWFDEMEGCGWIDHYQRPIQNWQSVLIRVRTKWEADGRPSGPPSSKYSPGASGASPANETEEARQSRVLREATG